MFDAKCETNIDRQQSRYLEGEIVDEKVVVTYKLNSDLISMVLSHFSEGFCPCPGPVGPVPEGNECIKCMNCAD